MTSEQLSLILAATGLCLGVLICLILLFSNKSKVFANRLLAVTVFGFTLGMLQVVMVYTGWLLKFPHFFRIPSPFFYLSLATAYLYVRAVVNDETRLKKFDFLLFLPAILHFVELLPFYLKPASEKKQIITQLMQDPALIVQMNEGVLPPYLHNLIRAFMGVLFVIFMARLLLKVADEAKPEVKRSATFNWLKWFTALMGLMVIATLSVLLVPQSDYLNKTVGVNLAVIICFVIQAFYLFFRPQILYGIPRSPNRMYKI